VLDNP